jgi:hypothetical protein
MTFATTTVVSQVLVLRTLVRNSRGWLFLVAGASEFTLGSVFTLIISNELRDFGVRTHRLNHDDVAFVEEHSIRTVHFVAAPDQDILDLFCLLIHLILNVVHVRQLRKFRIGIGKLAKINLIIVEQDCGVRSRDFCSFSVMLLFASNCRK